MPALARHAEPPTGRRWRLPVHILIATSALTIVGSAVLTLAHGSAGCAAGRTGLEVVASPDIAPAVAGVVRADADLRAPRGCPQLRVRAGSEADVLAGLAGEASSAPDVWIPSSSMWVERAGPLVSPASQASIASSPLVLALPATVADRLRPGEDAPSWDDVTTAGYAGNVVLNPSEPEASPATVSLVGALEASLAGRPDGRAVLAGLLLGARMVSEVADGPTALSVLHSAPSAAVPLPEQAVWAAEGRPPVARPSSPSILPPRRPRSTTRTRSSPPTARPGRPPVGC